MLILLYVTLALLFLFTCSYLDAFDNGRNFIAQLINLPPLYVIFLNSENGYMCNIYEFWKQYKAARPSLPTGNVMT